jgi:uncharacterized protein YbbK (DUF523 family)/uncharacterized protein YbgA (DUF1722 family)
MFNFEKPVICVSKCLGFECCRYNGTMSKDDLVNNLKSYVDFIPVCPEVEIGMSIPREALRLVNNGDNIKLIVQKNGEDFTEKMLRFTASFLDSIPKIDGFLLKSKSPSCGIRDVKIYSSNEKGASCDKGSGLFASKVLTRFNNAVIEDEGRLSNYNLRELFLTKIFLYSEFRRIIELGSVEALLKFTEQNKLLFMSYNQKECKTLEKLASNIDVFNFHKAADEYQEHLNNIFSRSARYTSKIKVLLQVLQSFKSHLNLKEQTFVLEVIDMYSKGRIPFTTPLYLIKSYLVRFDCDDILKQSFFEPFPQDLVELRDSGKGLCN